MWPTNVLLLQQYSIFIMHHIFVVTRLFNTRSELYHTHNYINWSMDPEYVVQTDSFIWSIYIHCFIAVITSTMINQTLRGAAVTWSLLAEYDIYCLVSMDLKQVGDCLIKNIKTAKHHIQCHIIF